MRFSEELRKLLAQVPPGRVTTFGSLASALGDPRAAVPVSRHIRESRPPGWHRVVRANGALTIGDAARLLLQEGVAVDGGAVANFQKVLFRDFLSDRPLEALRKQQQALADAVVLEDGDEDLERVGGFDVSYQGFQAHAAAASLDLKTQEVLEEIGLTTTVDFPYISTYLAYREFEPVARCYARFEEPPDLLLIDGNGTLHPERFGVACHVGLKLDRPTIGVAKRLLLGRTDRKTLGPGEFTPVRVNGDVLAYALRSGEGKPIYVSPGHRISLETALHIVRRLCRTRIPEPLRLADRAARRIRLNPKG